MSRRRTILYLLLAACPIATPDPASAHPKNIQQNITVTVYFDADQYSLTPAADTSSIAARTSIYRQLSDKSTRTGTSIILNDVVFIGGRHQPLGFSYIAINDVLKAMKENSGLRIRIESHVCCMPENADGPDLDTGESDLSVQRAK